MFDRFKIEMLKRKYAGKGQVRSTTNQALRKASEIGNYSDVIFLCSEVKDVNEPGEDSGMNAAHRAARAGHANIFQVLEQNGANCNLPNRKNNKTPLQYAEENKRDALVAQHRKYHHFFALPNDLLNSIVMGFLNYDGIVNLMQLCRSTYTKSILFEFYRTLPDSSHADKIHYLRKTPYHQIFYRSSLLSMKKDDQIELIKRKFNFQIHPSYHDNLYAVIILYGNYLLNETIEKLMSNTELAKIIFTHRGLLCFQNSILTDQEISRLIEEPNVRLFDALMCYGFDELQSGTITFESVWNNRIGLNTILGDYGITMKFSKAIEMVESNSYAEPIRDMHGDPVFNPFLR